MEVKHSTGLSQCVTCCTVIESFHSSGNIIKGKMYITGVTLKDLTIVCPCDSNGCITSCSTLQFHNVVFVDTNIRAFIIKHWRTQRTCKKVILEWDFTTNESISLDVSRAASRLLCKLAKLVNQAVSNFCNTQPSKRRKPTAIISIFDSRPSYSYQGSVHTYCGLKR